MPHLRFVLLGGYPQEAAEPLRVLERGDHLVVFALRDEAVGVGAPLREEDYYRLEGEEADPTEAYLDRVDIKEAVDVTLDEEIRPLAEQVDARLDVVDVQQHDDYVTTLNSIHGHIQRRMSALRAPARFYMTTAPLHVTCAALMACVLQGIPVTIPDPNRRGPGHAKGGVTDLPIIRMEYALNLTPKERETLQAVIRLDDESRTGGLPPNLTRVARQLGVKPPTLTKRVQRMEQAGVLAIQPGASRREIILVATPAGRILLGVDSK